MSETQPSSPPCAVVTGATAGIGLASALALAKSGFSVIGVGRNPQRCEAAQQALREACPSGQARCLVADLSLQSQVRAASASIHAQLQDWGSAGLDILVNNAGLYSQSFHKTAEGIELTLAVNHLAPFLLTHELLPLLRSAPAARVITVSSDSHYNTWINPRQLNRPLVYLGIWAYKQSKLSNILFTLEWNRRFASRSMRAFAVDPGLVRTEIASKGQRNLSSLVWHFRQRAGVEPDVPARTILYLATQPGLESSTDLYWYDCQPKQPSRQSLDGKTAKELWQASCVLCQIPDQEEHHA
jgi:NAD(P)-dependent dehydrogenase (short-subunit alcohol dehydrogenase family)